MYHIKATGKNDTTNCITIEINVDVSSTLPTSIDGPDEVCAGNEVLLKQVGGELGPNSKWVWYKGSLNSKDLDKGPSIKIQPDETTVYYVRSESNDGIIKTKAIEKKVTVSKKSTRKIEIEYKTDNEKICEDKEIILKAKGELVEGDYWVWKENGKEISREIEIKRAPKGDVSYQLKIANEACGESDNDDTKEIFVYKRSISPSAITQSFDPVKKNKSKLIIEGGYLAEDSKWIWYYNNIGKEVKIWDGRDESIDVLKGWDEQIIFVKAKGAFCQDETNEVSTRKEIQYKANNAKSASGFALNYQKSSGKWFHFGLHLGLDYFNIKDSISSITDSIGKQSYNIQSMAYFIGGEVHPIFKEYFYLGFNGGYGAFANNYLNYPQLSGSNEDRTEIGTGNLSYLGSEMGWTISKEHAVKMFFKYTRTSFQNNLSVRYTETDSISGSTFTLSEYKNTSNIVIDRASVGFRFGAFGSKGKTNQKSGNPKLGTNFDILINLHNKTNLDGSRMLTDFSSFSKFGDWKLGVELAFWKHSVLRMGFNMGFNSSFKELSASGNEFLPDYFIAKLAYNFDLFR